MTRNGLLATVRTAVTVAAIIAADFMIRREEKQLEREFGNEWLRYKSEVRRWL